MINFITLVTAEDVDGNVRVIRFEFGNGTYGHGTLDTEHVQNVFVRFAFGDSMFMTLLRVQVSYCRLQKTLYSWFLTLNIAFVRANMGSVLRYFQRLVRSHDKL